MFGSIFFIGHVIGSTLLSEYGDTIGRIPMLRFGQGVSTLCYIMIVFCTKNVYVIYSLIFIFGLLSCCRSNLAFVYGSEILAETHQTTGGCIFNLFDATILIFSCCFIIFVSDYWFDLHSIFTGFAFLAFVIFCFLPESPKYLVQRENYEKAIQAYNFMAKFSGRADMQFSRAAGHRF
jgi:MFS family permease